jgi:hypothetical protein
MGAYINVKIIKGEVLTEVEGVIGTLCESITRALHDALGGEVTTETKPEFFIELEGTKVEVHESNE